MLIEVANTAGKVWLPVFNEQAEKLIGCQIKSINDTGREDFWSQSFSFSPTIMACLLAQSNR